MTTQTSFAHLKREQLIKTEVKGPTVWFTGASTCKVSEQVVLFF